jgi:hypothetical protein
VRVRNHNRLHAQSVPLQDVLNVAQIVPWIDNYRFLGLFVAEDGTVAAQHAYRQNLVNHQ